MTDARTSTSHRAGARLSRTNLDYRLPGGTVRYTAPGPPQAQPVTDALDKPMTVTFTR